MGEPTNATQEMLDLLRQVDTPTVCNVVELFDVRPRNTGYMDARIRCCFPELPPMVGFATTATFRSHSPPRKGDVYASMEEQLSAFVDVAGPPVVVFQDLDDPRVSATFGEVMCATYKAFGAVGIVTSGAGRDLEQVRALKFPAFAAGTICAHGYCHTLQINVPVHVGGLTIHPGDLIHGDCNGITTIPNEIAPAVARACREFIACEDEVLGYVKSPGAHTIEEFAVRRKRMAERIRMLGEKLRGNR
jgi:regulator of RNase E activity RraA